ncbi:MAG: tetratricopeptide repeat protein [Acidobacteriota bacterium]
MDFRYLDRCYRIADRMIDPIVGTLGWAGDARPLSRKQLEVLALLASHRGATVSRADFIEQVWDGDKLVGDKGLTNIVYELRRALQDTESSQPLIRTIPRRGYQLNGEAEVVFEEMAPAFAEGQTVPGRPGWRLDARVAGDDVAETWLVSEPQSQERRTFRFCRSEEQLQVLRREVDVLRFLRDHLTNHRHLASFVDWRLDEPPYFLEMEPTVHGSLRGWSASPEGVRSSLDERLRLVAEAANGLEAMHSLGVVHGNISPSSLLVDRDGRGTFGKLGEFGRVRLMPGAAPENLQSGLTFGAIDLGSQVLYRAPECQGAHDLEPAVDIYALGVVLQQTLLGDWSCGPTEGELKALDPALREIITACVDAKPGSRPSAQGLCERLEGIRRDRTQLATEIETTRRASPPVASAPSTPPGVGRSIGPYRLLDVLGEGGMGTVYLAEQREPVERQVALKLIRAGLDGKQVLARFEAERQALALMDHENVAAVYDAGPSASGHPYFVMEHVPGPDILSYCDRAKLGLRSRIELFTQVCDGVHHAHQKGLIHRDLKPGNVLVKKPTGESATVKIIDFGVAKSLQKKLSPRTVHTRIGTFVGTPHYSSPEQVSDLLPDVDTRSDVYSLGILLYELLTGVTPHSPEELTGKSSAELAKILSEEPPTPRSRFTHLDAAKKEEIASNRSRSVPELEQRLDADVSWIILKCLEPEPDDRYSSIPELKKDLKRWLVDEPVEARPTTGLYRVRKLIRRHRTPVALAALIAVALLTSTAVAVAGFMRAEEEASKARAAALEAEKAAEFQARQLASVDPSSIGIGIRASLREAVGAHQAPGDEAKKEQLDQLLRGVNFTDLTLGQLQDNFFEPALREIEASYGDYPLLQSRLWQATAETLREWGQFDRAAEAQELALNRRREVVGPDHPLTLVSLRNRGNLFRKMGRTEEAEADLRSAAESLRQILGTEDPATLDALTDLAMQKLAQGELDEAETLLHEALEGRRRVLGEEHRGTLELIENLGTLRKEQGKLDEAEALYREVLERRQRALGDQDIGTLASLNALGMILRSQGKLEESEEVQRQSLDRVRELRGDDHPDTLTASSNLALILTSLGQHDEAEKLQRETLEIRRRLLGDDHPVTLNSHFNLGSALQAQGELEEAEVQVRIAAEGCRRAFGEKHPITLGVTASLGKLMQKLDRFSEAEVLIERALEGYEQTLGPDHPSTAGVLMALGSLRRDQGRLADAEARMRQGVEKQRRALGAEHPQTLSSIQALDALLGDIEPSDSASR